MRCEMLSERKLRGDQRRPFFQGTAMKRLAVLGCIVLTAACQMNELAEFATTSSTSTAEPRRDPNTPSLHKCVATKIPPFDRVQECTRLLTSGWLTKGQVPVVHLARGAAYEALDRNVDAFNDFEVSISLNPDHVEGYIFRAAYYARSRHYEDAVEDAQKAINLNPAKPWPYQVLCFALIGTMQKVRAYQNCKIALERRAELALKEDLDCAAAPGRSIERFQYTRCSGQPEFIRKSAHLFTTLGNHYKKRFGYRDAQMHYEESIRLSPKKAEPFVQKGLLYFASKQYERAQEDFKFASGVEPGYPASYYGLALVSSIRGKLEEALEYLQFALNLKADYAEAYNLRGNVYRAKKQFKKANQSFDKAIEYKPGYAAAFNDRGESKFAQGRYDDAMSDADESIRLKPRSATAFLLKGKILGKTEKYSQAIEAFDRAIDLRPKYFRAFLLRGYSHQKLKSWKKAKVDFTQALNLNQNSFHAWANRGRANAALGFLEESVIDFDRALRLKPGHQTIVQGKALVLAKQSVLIGLAKDVSKRNRPKAIKLVRQSISLHTDQKYMRLLGLLLALEGQFSAAVDAQTEAISLMRRDGVAKAKIAKETKILNLYKLGKLTKRNFDMEVRLKP